MKRSSFLTPRRALLATLVVSALFLAPAAQALEADSADDVCSPAADPCNVTTEVDIVDGSTLDFGLRRVNVTNGGRFDFQSNSGAVQCGQLDVNVSGAFVNAAGPIGGGETGGGLIQLEARKGCANDTDRPCLRVNDCFIGSCNQRRCTGDTTISCSTNAAVCAGTCNGGFCSNKPTKSCNVSGDCDFGPCPASLSCSGDLSVQCSANADCNLGACSVGSGTMTLGGRINGNATEPAVVIVRAAGNIAFNANVLLNGTTADSDGGEMAVDSFGGSVTVNNDLSATGGGLSQGGEITISAKGDVIINDSVDVNGGDFDGGVVEFEAGNDYVQNTTILANAISGEGFGGEVVLDALRDLTVTAGTVNNRNRVATEGNMGPDFFGGDGGTQEFTSGRDMFLSTFTRFEGNGAAPDGLGADLFVSAGRNFFLDGEIEAKARGGLGGGGFIQVEADGDIEIGTAGNIDLFGGETGGGACEILPDGDLIHRGIVDVSGGTGGPGGSIEVESGGDMLVSGTFSGAGASGSRSDGQMRIEGCRLNLTSTGEIDNTIDGGTNTIIIHESAVLDAGSQLIATGVSGSNTIIHRDVNKPPTLSGTVSPAATILINEDLAGCPVCGNGEIDKGEHCDDGNVDAGDGCSPDCLDEGCIADTPGFPGTDLCDDGNACTADSCNVETSSCENVFLCDDGIDCTVDACVDDACANTADDSACEDDDVCTDNVCVVGTGCTFPTNTAACDDGLFCTVDDVCDSGVCGGTARDCDDAVDCTVDSCDEGGGTCVQTPDDDFCQDGAFCNGEEVCDDSTGCGAGDPVDCSGLDDVCLSGVCDEAADECSTDPANEDGVCDDGLASTENDRCINGFCRGDDIDCSDGVDCTIDSFNDVTQLCESVPDDTLCDNGDFCDGAETCSADSGCLVPEPVDCSGLDDQCLAGVCDEDADACVAQAANESESCDDGMFCTVNDACGSGVCAGVARDCGDGVSCTVDSCDEEGGSCSNLADDSACDNGLFCDGVETCDVSTDCQAGTAVDCSSLDTTCEAGVCDEDLDACGTEAANEGGSCDDGLFCTVNDTCQAGVCVGEARDCSDGQECSIDSCDEGAGMCTHTADDSVCDNGLFCDGAETCNVETGCEAGAAVDCSGLDDQCEAGVCDEDADACAADPANEGEACDDGLFCTVDDQCVEGQCTGGARDCDDGVSCTVDTCDDEAGSCSNATDDSLCDDEFFCNGAETCDAVGGCQAGTAVDCSDLDGDCATGVCDEGADSCVAEAANEGASCDDGDICTDDDVCVAGTCTGTDRENCLVCGNGFVEPGEECDDGDTEFAFGEQCGADCQDVPCGQPTNSGRVRPSATDALFVLKSAVRIESCSIAVCDVSGDGSIRATDALTVLNAAVGRAVEFNCPTAI